MANENDYQDDMVDKYTQDLLDEIQQLEGVIICSDAQVKTLENVVSNREAEIDKLKEKVEQLEATVSLLRDQLRPNS